MAQQSNLSHRNTELWQKAHLERPLEVAAVVGHLKYIFAKELLGLALQCVVESNADADRIDPSAERGLIPHVSQSFERLFD